MVQWLLPDERRCSSFQNSLLHCHHERFFLNKLLSHPLGVALGLLLTPPLKRIKSLLIPCLGSPMTSLEATLELFFELHRVTIDTAYWVMPITSIEDIVELPHQVTINTALRGSPLISLEATLESSLSCIGSLMTPYLVLPLISIEAILESLHRVAINTAPWVAIDKPRGHLGVTITTVLPDERRCSSFQNSLLHCHHERFFVNTLSSHPLGVALGLLLTPPLKRIKSLLIPCLGSPMTSLEATFELFFELHRVTIDTAYWVMPITSIEDILELPHQVTINTAPRVAIDKP